MTGMESTLGVVKCNVGWCGVMWYAMLDDDVMWSGSQFQSRLCAIVFSALKEIQGNDFYLNIGKETNVLILNVCCCVWKDYR